jgi:hypothetical protein
MVLVDARDGTKPVRRQKLVLVEEVAQDADQPLLRREGQEHLHVLAFFHEGQLIG